ncbi:hypothetical protein BaRGS_00022139, partial [Batillaria attramentaria]
MAEKSYVPPPAPVTAQPGGAVYQSPDGVVVRNMREDDSEFAGRLTVDAFSEKFIHAIGTEKRRVRRTDHDAGETDTDPTCGRCISQVSQRPGHYTCRNTRLPVAYRASAADRRLAAFKYHRIFIAEYQGRPAGLMQLHFRGDRPDPDAGQWQNGLSCWPACRMACLSLALDGETVARGNCYVDHICVAEGFRGKGIGKALLTVADQQAVAGGCHTIYLWVADDNRAKNLYERQGYHVTTSSTMCCLASCLTGKR